MTMQNQGMPSGLQYENWNMPGWISNGTWQNLIVQIRMEHWYCKNQLLQIPAGNIQEYRRGFQHVYEGGSHMANDRQFREN